jgi:hypothetical protein
MLTEARHAALSVAAQGHVSEMAKADFEAAEATIAADPRAFLEVGEALLEVQRGAGHRHLGFSCFDDYLRARWRLGSGAIDWHRENARVVMAVHR